MNTLGQGILRVSLWAVCAAGVAGVVGAVSSRAEAATDESSVNQTNLVRCNVPFEHDSSSIGTRALDRCLASISPSDVRYFEIFATATPRGDTEYNRRLSERRARVLRTHLERRFPGVRVSDPHGGGENPARGARGTIVAVLTPEAAARVAAIAPDQSALAGTFRTNEPVDASLASRGTVPGMDSNDTVASLGNPSATGARGDTGNTFESTGAATPAIVRIAFRGGLDEFRKNGTWYPSSGIDLTLFPYDAGAARVETGVVGSMLSRNDVLDLYNAYAYAGAAWRLLPGADVTPIVGVRGLGGITWHSRQERTGDGGGELRVGAEGRAASVFASAGITRTYTRFGLDAGVKF